MSTGRKGAASAEARRKPEYEIRIDRTYDDPQRSLRAVASMSIGSFAVHGIRLYESESGTFVSMPAVSYRNPRGETKYSDVFHPITAEARESLGRAVVEAYRRTIDEAEAQGQRVGEAQAAEPAEAPAEAMRQL